MCDDTKLYAPFPRKWSIPHIMRYIEQITNIRPPAGLYKQQANLHRNQVAQQDTTVSEATSQPSQQLPTLAMLTETMKSLQTTVSLLATQLQSRPTETYGITYDPFQWTESRIDHICVTTRSCMRLFLGSGVYLIS